MLTEVSAGPILEKEAPRSGVPSPSLTICNNCMEEDHHGGENLEPSLSRILNRNQKKRATVIRIELEDIVEKYALGRLVCITLTFQGRAAPSRSECERMYHSFYNNVLSKLFVCGVTVFERSNKGRPHYHLVGVLMDEAADIRTGWDFEAYNAYTDLQRQYFKTKDKGDWARMMNAAKSYGGSANDELRELWDGPLSQESLAKYGMGIAHAVPVKSPAAVAVYYAKYLTKDSPGGEKFKEEDKGARTYRIWGKRRRKITLQHTPVNDASRLFWKRLNYVAYQLGLDSYGDYARVVGPKWYYYFGDHIQDIPKEIVTLWATDPYLFEDPALINHPMVKEAQWWNDRIHRQFSSLWDPEKDKVLS
jgi:hypothetical protein